MAKRESIIKKLLNNWEKSYYQLNENVIYGQRLAKIGSWTYDLQKKEVFWTEEIYKILECSTKELDKEIISFLPFVHPDDLETVIQVTQYVSDAKEYDLEYRIVSSKGSLKYVHEKTMTTYDEHNNPFKVVGIIQDITDKKLREINLEALGDHLNQAQRVAGVGSWKYDVIKDDFFVSDEMFHIFGIKSYEFKNDFNNAIKLIHPEDQFRLQEVIKMNLSGKSCTTEFRIPQPDETCKFVIGNGEPIFDNEDRLICIIGTLRDITEQKELQKQIDLEQEKTNNMRQKFQVLVQESSDVYEIISPDGNIIYISDAVEKVLGCKKEDRIGKNLFDFYKGNDSIKLSKMIDMVINEPDKKVKGEVDFTDKLGKKIHVEVDMRNLLNDPYVQGIVINFRDISKRVLMEKRMAHITTHDELTQLPNNVYFKKKLRMQCQYAKETNTKFALIRMDINEQKNIQISFGSEICNQLINSIVQRLKNYLNNIFLSRCADDQFAIIVHGIETIEAYESIVKELIGLFNQPFIIDKFEINVSVNIGVCICPDDAKDFESIKKNSYIALNRSIKEGRNLYKFFSKGLDIQYYKEFTLMNDLHKAIENNEIRVFYQPIVNLKTNEIIATEALLRWEHPDWGMLTPDEFIPMAEETGVIIDIGKHIIKEICLNYKKWSNMKSNLKISVNFSIIQFLESNLVDNIIKIMDEYKVNPNVLIIEITESILINKVEKVTYDIERLKAFGIQIALDDFGTGYSSLAYLNSFNIDILKIDGSFVKKIITDKTSNVITKCIISMAQELKIKLVAEGIENWDQLTHLRGLNCYAGQGHIYSKPVELEGFETLLSIGRCKPVNINYNSTKIIEERRKYFRINFHHLLEADMTILNIKGKNVNVGNIKVLVKNLGPGGLSFISNTKLPIENDLNLLFMIQLLEKDIKVYGHPMWIDELGDNIYEYGLEFAMDENERAEITRIFSLVQIKMRKDILFAEGNFKSESPYVYFNKK